MRADSRICCIFNFAPHYRKGIYLEMTKRLNCDFFFGDRVGTRIRKLDYGLLGGGIRELKYLPLFSHFYWMRGAGALSLRPEYSAFLLTGEPYCLSNWLVMLVARLTGRRAFLWSHGWYGDEGRVKTLIKKAFFGLANGVFLYGHHAKKLMEAQGIPGEKLWVVYNSLDYDQQKALRPTLSRSEVYRTHFQNERPTLIFLGRLTPVKKLNVLIEALALAKDQEKARYNLVLVGDGSAREELEALVEKYQLQDRVWFYGACYEEARIAELVYNADLCVSPGNVGLTVIHTLSYGTPVITHDHYADQMPEFEAVVPGETGAFFRKDDPDSLLRAIGEWLEARPEKSRETVERCWQVIDEKYNPGVQIEVLLEHLGPYQLSKAG